ncbi:MAG: hypothetical protein ABIN35_01120 [candidate division WOR-3 bacterium]
MNDQNQFITLKYKDYNDKEKSHEDLNNAIMNHIFTSARFLQSSLPTPSLATPSLPTPSLATPSLPTPSLATPSLPTPHFIQNSTNNIYIRT